jgi:flagellar biosynthesis activator protein FlaF
MYNQGSQAYLRTQQTTANPRELEASLLIKAAARLQNARENLGANPAELDDALTFNRKLWTILSTSATRQDSPLPRDLKNNVAQLAVFIFGHTMRILSDPHPDRISTLITINANIAAGLRGSAS